MISDQEDYQFLFLGLAGSCRRQHGFCTDISAPKALHYFTGWSALSPVYSIGNGVVMVIALESVIREN